MDTQASWEGSQCTPTYLGVWAEGPLQAQLVGARKMDQDPGQRRAAPRRPRPFWVLARPVDGRAAEAGVVSTQSRCLNPRPRPKATYLLRSVDSHTLTTLMTSLTVLRKSCILAATRSAGKKHDGARDRGGQASGRARVVTWAVGVLPGRAVGSHGQ